MTRQQLLNRLLVLRDQGEEMGAEIRIRVSRRVADKRTRSGYRSESKWVKLQNACAGTNGHDNGRMRYAELNAVPVEDWTGEWHS